MSALKVLIIEDDALIAMLLTEIVKDLDHDVCATVATEDDAVAMAARFKPGLMIVDEHLREGSGVSAVERILLTGPVPYIFISGAHVNCARQGVTVLLKPFLVQDLAQAIQNTVGDVRALRAPIYASGTVVPDLCNQLQAPIRSTFDHSEKSVK